MKKNLTILAVSMCLLGGVLSAQEFRSTIAGHVLDPSGAAVPNAKVQAIHLATDTVTSATTDSGGTYTIPYLRPGAYKVTVSATGFKNAIRDNVELEAAKIFGLDVHLEVGALTESVEVTAQTVALETQSATRSSIVSERQVADMPLNARNPFMLGAMMSGVTFNGAAIWQRPFDNGAIAQWSINGGRDSSSEYMLDGASNNGQMGSNNIGLVPTVDSVQEFNVMVNMYNAEYGHTGSGIMNVVLKSGTRSHHGSVYEFMRRTPLDANTFQNNAIVASATNPTGGAPRPNHYLDQYGFEVDGPVTIPGLLRKDGKVRLFYMGALELYREGTPNPLLVSWPTAEMRTGDFSKLVDGAGTPIKIYDPTTATYDANGNVTSPRLQFPNNTIPTPRLNPVAVAVTKFMPLPNQATVAGFRYGTNNLSLPGYFDKDKFYNLALKFDWNFGDKHRAFFRHASNDRTEDRSVNGLDNVPGTDGQQPFQRINDAYVIDWVSTFGPTTLVNIRSSFNRFIEKGYGAANANFDLTKLGVSPALIASLPNPDKAYFGRWNFDNGYNSLGRSQSNNYTNTYQLSGSVTKVRGSHSFKAGIDVRQINYLIQNTGDLLSYTGQNTWTANAFTGASSVTGDGYASFLLGDVSGSSNYPLFPWWKQWYYAPYLNDDWKVTRRLTLNLGIRWDFLTPQYEKWARQNGPFDASAATSIAAAVAANVTALGSQLPASIAANLSNLKGGLTFAGVNGVGQNPFPVQRNAIQPRVGFAYQLRDRLVIRGGFGEYFSDPTNDYQRTSGFSTSTSITNSLDNGRTPIANILSNPYPNGLLKPTGASLGTATFVGQNPSWFDPGFQIPSVWQFSLGFQYRTSANATIEVSYVGSRSYNLNMQKDTNVIPLSVRKACDFIEGGDARVCSAQLPNPFKGVAAFNGTSFYTSNTLSYGQLSRPFPQFNGNVTQLGRNDSFITYNSLQINYNWRTNKGVTFMANYTLSKQIEEWGFNDVQQGVYQQGPYTLDRPQILKFSSVWALPFGQGQRFGSNVHGFLNKLISGWEANGFFVDPLSGYPANLPGNAILLKDPRTPGGGFTGDVNWKGYVVREWNPCVLRATDNSGTGGAAATVAPTPNSLALGCGTDPANYAWLMTGANTPARFLPFRSGNIRVHHAVQLDFSILKRTQITERTSAQLGFEAFNILNHNYFGRDNVNTDPTSLNFGAVVPSIVSTQNILPRQIQVRFKFNW